MQPFLGSLVSRDICDPAYSRQPQTQCAGVSAVMEGSLRNALGNLKGTGGKKWEWPMPRVRVERNPRNWWGVKWWWGTKNHKNPHPSQTHNLLGQSVYIQG